MTGGDRGEGRGENFYTFIGSKLWWGEGENLTLTINASYTPLLVLKRRIQFLLITNWRRYGSHFWPKGERGGGEREIKLIWVKPGIVLYLLCNIILLKNVLQSVWDGILKPGSSIFWYMFIFFFITGVFGEWLDFLLRMVVVLLWHWMVVVIIFNGHQLVCIVSNFSVSYFGTVDISSWYGLSERLTRKLRDVFSWSTCCFSILSCKYDDWGNGNISW